MLINRIAERLARIDEAGSDGVFAWRTTKRALEEARAADRRVARGLGHRPLEGTTVAWKDVFDLAGCRTRAGTRFLGPQPASHDHPLVTRLGSLGAICVGKTSQTELALSVLGENDVVPAPANPSDEERACGGSSSGAAAAVARGLADIGIGTDSGGSVRLPAAWCGVVGFKPTTARVEARGVVPFSPTLDAVGVLASTVAAAVAAFEALSGHWVVAADGPASVVLKRAPIPPELRPDPAVAQVYDAALDRLAHAGIATQEAACDPLAWTHALRREHGSIAAIEGGSLWRSIVIDAGELASPRLRRWFASTAGGEGDLARLRLARRRLTARLLGALPPGTALVLPASPIEAPVLRALEHEQGYERLHARSHALLWPFNELDAPAISIPCGRSANGLPVGLQIAAPRGRDRDVLAAAAAAESALAAAPNRPTTRATGP